MNDETAHVTFLQGALKSAARPKPTFKGLQQSDISSFANFSQVFENVCVGTYLMTAPAISSKVFLNDHTAGESFDHAKPVFVFSERATRTWSAPAVLLLWSQFIDTYLCQGLLKIL